MDNICLDRLCLDRLCLDRPFIEDNQLKVPKLPRNEPFIVYKHEQNDRTFKNINMYIKEITDDDVSEVSIINLSKYNIRFISNDLNLFLNLTDLNLSHNNLSDIKITLKKLIKLDLSHNNLTDIDNVKIINMKNIEEINLQHNLLTRFNITFEDLLYLEKLDLSNNKLTSMCCCPNFIEKSKENKNKYKSKLYLNLSHNEISSFDLFIPRLLTLNLSHNKLKSLIDYRVSDINDCEYLSSLNIKYNELCLLPDIKIKLKYLNISRNKIEKLPEINFDSLTYLNISNNKIQKLPESFKNIKPEILYLHNNCLLDIPKFNTELLDEITIANNKLSTISIDILNTIYDDDYSSDIDNDMINL